MPSRSTPKVSAIAAKLKLKMFTKSIPNLMPRGQGQFESYAPSGLGPFAILCPIGAGALLNLMPHRGLRRKCEDFINFYKLLAALGT